VFSDRLIDEVDREWFTAKFGESLKKIPDENDSPVEPEVYSNFVFGDFYDNDKEYKLLPDLEKDLPKILTDRYLSVYNSQNAKQMNLVFFKDAIKHLSRICRVLR
jgi:dynein heavy chain